jgi:glucan biosynthesis protein C
MHNQETFSWQDRVGYLVLNRRQLVSTSVIDVVSTTAQPAAAEVRSAGKARLLYIDNVRTLLITLVVLCHVAVTYGAEGAWYYSEAGEESTVAFIIIMPLLAIGAAFLLGLFFLIAGYFTPRAYDRKGAGPLVVDRLKRLGIPLLFYDVIVLPLIHYALAVHDGSHDALWPWLTDYVQSRRSFADGPVWFLEALLIFSLLYALWRVGTKSVPARAQSDIHKDGTVPGNGAIALFALAVGVATFVVRIWARANVYFEPWHLEFAHFAQYIAMFAAGIVAYRRNWLVRFSDAQAKTWRWIALVCILLLPALVVAAGALTGELDERGGGGLNWLSLAYSIWEGFMCVGMVITVLAWFRRRFDHQGRLARAMSETCFAVYVLHPLIIVPLALALSGIQLNLGLKFLLVAPVAVALCYLSAYYVRKLPFLRSIL